VEFQLYYRTLKTERPCVDLAKKSKALTFTPKAGDDVIDCVCVRVCVQGRWYVSWTGSRVHQAAAASRRRGCATEMPTVQTDRTKPMPSVTTITTVSLLCFASRQINQLEITHYSPDFRKQLTRNGTNWSGLKALSHRWLRGTVVERPDRDILRCQILQRKTSAV